VIRSKQLRNEIAGYITDFVKKESRSTSEKALAEEGKK
jgi:ribosomal protein S17E